MKSGRNWKKWNFLYAVVALVIVILLLLAIIFVMLSVKKIKAPSPHRAHQHEFIGRSKYSNFDSTKYICTGTCSCELEKEARRNGVVIALGKGVATLVVGVSAYYALRAAHRIIQQECEVTMKTSCGKGDMGNVISFVDDCSEVKDESQLETEFSDDSSFMESRENKKKKTKQHSSKNKFYDEKYIGRKRKSKKPKKESSHLGRREKKKIDPKDNKWEKREVQMLDKNVLDTLDQAREGQSDSEKMEADNIQKELEKEVLQEEAEENVK